MSDEPVTRTGWATGSVLGTDAEGRLVTQRIALRVVKGPDVGASVELEAGTVIVGTHASAGLRLSDRSVSRQHAQLALLGAGVRVKDLDSKNGTFIADTRVVDATVPVPFELRVGSTRIDVRAADLPVATSGERTRFGRLVGRSPALRRAFSILEHAAPSAAPILFEGPEGAGKTAFCAAVHEASGRRGARLVLDPSRALDRATIDAAFDATAGGTLILEHVERWPRDATEALVAALDARHSDARVLATSREDLRAAVEAGRFPRPLYFFLASVRVVIPPLDERPEDIGPLVDAFLTELGQPAGAIPDELGQRVGRGLRGGARELRGLVEAAVARATDPTPSAPSSLGAITADRPYHEAKAELLEAFERRYLEDLMARHGGVVLHAAEEAGLGRNHLARLLKKHGLK